jgi:hypothetical protein
MKVAIDGMRGAGFIFGGGGFVHTNTYEMENGCPAKTQQARVYAHCGSTPLSIRY